MANCITCVRIICSIALLFCVPLGVPFNTIYITAGISDMIDGFVLYKIMISVHSISNKITGAMLFALPLLLHWIELEYLALIVCGAATIAAIQEGYYCWTKRFEV